MNNLSTKLAGVFLGLLMAMAGIQTVRAQGTVAVIEPGDFGSSFGSPTVIEEVLGLGTNTITGAISLIISGGAATADYDYFRINNPELYPILAISISVRNFEGVEEQSGIFELLANNPLFTSFVSDNSGIVFFNSNGDYDMEAVVGDVSSLFFGLQPPEASFIAGGYDYTVSIVTVPEPGTWALLATGLIIGCLALRQRCYRAR